MRPSPSPPTVWTPINPSTLPATTATFFFAAWARRTTSPGAFPTSDVLSKIPSAVMTRSAFANAASKPARSNTQLAPPVNSALAKNTRPAALRPQLREASQAGRELRNLLGASALLRSEDRGGAARAQQRRRDVG